MHNEWMIAWAHCLTLLFIYAASSELNSKDNEDILDLMKGIAYDQVEKLAKLLEMEMRGGLQLHTQRVEQNCPDMLACELVKKWWDKNTFDKDTFFKSLQDAVLKARHSETAKADTAFIHQNSTKITGQGHLSTNILPGNGDTRKCDHHIIYELSCVI